MDYNSNNIYVFDGEEISRMSYIPVQDELENGLANEKREEKELLIADISVEADRANADIIYVEEELRRVNGELSRYVNHADEADYAFAVVSGIISGVFDAFLIGEIRITDKDIGLSHRQINNFIHEYSKHKGFDRARLKDAISDLEEAFKVAQDNVWKGARIGVSAKNHHLADFAHHPTPVGLMCAIIVQFLRVGVFVNRDGEVHFLPVKTTRDELIQALVPAVITGILNWLVTVSEKVYEDESGQEIPRALRNLAKLIASTPLIVEVAKCADNWFGHLVSDMGGSKNTAGKGMGIPGIFLSLLYELSALPILNETGLSQFVNDLYEKRKIDLRREMTLYRSLGTQALPVIFNELLVRTGYFVAHLSIEASKHLSGKEINWNNVLPFGNRTVDRMLSVAGMTFTMADTTDAAIHAALESGANWVLFAGRFVTRFNYIGAGRAALAIVREISSEQEEIQLMHEKRILTEAKTVFTIKQLETYKAQLAERLAIYLAEDIVAFVDGFNYMNHGLVSGDSNLVIKGNVIIQKILGRKPQFTNQNEFDDLMESDTPFNL